MAVNVAGRTRPALALPVLAGLAAAIAGGVAWALVLKYTQYEIGFLAIGIGALAALAIRTLTHGYRDSTLQVAAVAAALVGVVVGKYLGYLLWGQDNGYTFSGMWGWIDALWVGLAVMTAWQLLDPSDDVEPALDHGPRDPD